MAYDTEQMVQLVDIANQMKIVGDLEDANRIADALLWTFVRTDGKSPLSLVWELGDSRESFRYDHLVLKVGDRRLSLPLPVIIEEQRINLLRYAVKARRQKGKKVVIVEEPDDVPTLRSKAKQIDSFLEFDGRERQYVYTAWAR